MVSSCPKPSSLSKSFSSYLKWTQSKSLEWPWKVLQQVGESSSLALLPPLIPRHSHLSPCSPDSAGPPHHWAWTLPGSSASKALYQVSLRLLVKCLSREVSALPIPVYPLSSSLCLHYIFLCHLSSPRQNIDFLKTGLFLACSPLFSTYTVTSDSGKLSENTCRINQLFNDVFVDFTFT